MEENTFIDEFLLFPANTQNKNCTHYAKTQKKMRAVMGIKGRRVHMIEELSETIISFQRGKTKKN